MRSTRPHLRLTSGLLASLLLLFSTATPSQATCGGGGGGGLGGMTTTAEPQIFRVPWKVATADGKVAGAALVFYWFPASPGEAQASELLESRQLTVAASQCVGYLIVPDTLKDLRAKFNAPMGGSLLVLAGGDGTEVGRLANGDVKVNGAEKLLKGAMDARKKAAEANLDSAEAKTKAGDADGAAALYTQVVADRCLLPSQARKAGKALKKMGREVPEELSLLDVPEVDLSPATTERLAGLLRQGIKAENEGRLADAQKVYEQAVATDPRDAVALRFLGEYHRHHSGNWKEARKHFRHLLEMPADPLSRAVALHGLGKMTIHGGDFQGGVKMLEQSIATYPLALAYRNLAVFWNSEKQPQKAHGYVLAALALDGTDVYNRIFAATYLVELGRPDEARRIAEENERVIEASYNLAAIWAQLGEKERALALLYRHFFLYEQFADVRSKEMQEARDDYVFASLHQDPAFVELTKDAVRDSESYHQNQP